MILATEIFVLLCVVLLLPQAAALQAESGLVEVVFVLFGKMPSYMHTAVELAARLNPVTLISDTNPAGAGILGRMHLPEGGGAGAGVKVVQVNGLMTGARDFEKVYLHLSRDHSAGRKLHELRCFQRWFILRDYMRYNTPAGRAGTFFGDGDTALFANATMAWKASTRRACDATVATPGTAHAFNWVSTGCSSFWTLSAIESFCTFLLETYKENKYMQILRSKAARGSSVVDMSLLWLWFVRALPEAASGFSAGRPWHSLNPHMTTAAFRAAYDNSLRHSREVVRKLPLKDRQEDALPAPLRVCNGLDVVRRTVLDHMRGWSDGAAPALPLPPLSLSLSQPRLAAAGAQQQRDRDTANTEKKFGPLELGCTYGCPSITADALRSGGVPETTDAKEAEALSDQRLFLLTLHYQGESKAYMTYDICRTLYATGGGSAAIRDPMVVDICRRGLRSSGSGASDTGSAASRDEFVSDLRSARSNGTTGEAGGGGAADKDAEWPCLPHLLYGAGHASKGQGQGQGGAGKEAPTVCF